MNTQIFNSQQASSRREAKNGSPARAVLLGSLALLPSLTLAEVKVCNQYPESVYTAIGYRTTTGVSTEGWWEIASGACTVVYDKPVADPFYIHSHTAWREHQDGRRTRRQWGGGERLAVSRVAFRLDRANVVGAEHEHEEFNFMNNDKLGNGRSYDVEYIIESDGVHSTTHLRTAEEGTSRTGGGPAQI